MPSDSQLDRLPPHSTESERGILGCILLNPAECIPVCLEHLDLGSGAFYDIRHRALYDHLLAMSEVRAPIDLITVQQRLLDARMLSEVGGTPYLSGLMDSVPSAANLTYYLDIVRDKHLLRRALVACTSAIEQVHAAPSAVEFLDRFERDALSIRGNSGLGGDDVDLKAQLNALVDEYQEAKNGVIKKQGVNTGLKCLDRRYGGLRPGEVFVIGGRPGDGKTSLAMNIAEYVAITERVPVGVFSLEMSAKELLARMASSRARMSTRRAEEGQASDEDLARLTKAMGAISHCPLIICDRAGLTIDQIAARARRWKQRHGVQLMVIDYLGLVRDSGRNRSRYESLTYITAEVKALAKETESAIILIAQLNRESVKEERAPRLSDLRDSGSIEQDADIVVLIHRGQEGTKLLTVKARRCPTGADDINFITFCTRFEDV